MKRVPGPASSARASAMTAASDAWHGRGTVLIVDDDEDVRALSAEAVRRVGLTVLSAADGPEAVELFQKRENEIRVVVLDRTMPGVSGEQVFDRLRAIRPDAQIILVSGYSEERAARELLDRGLAGFLQKPFSPEKLVDIVRRALERAG